MTLISLAIPIAIVVTILRRIQQATRRLNDPARLQRAFAESAAAALKRAGADPETVAKLEVLGVPGPPTATRRVALKRPPPPPRPQRPRRPQPVARAGGLDM